MTKAINLGMKSSGKFDPKGTYEELIAGDLVSLDDRVTVAGKFVIRTAAGDESIESGKDALLLEVIGGCGSLESEAFKINALRWNGRNAIVHNETDWSRNCIILQDKGVDTDTMRLVNTDNHDVLVIHTPKCEAGAYGTAEKNNGWLLTDSAGNNLHIGDGLIMGVWHSATLPNLGSEVTAVTDHTFAGHPEHFYLPDEGYMVIEIDVDNKNAFWGGGAIDYSRLCCHLAWSKDYDKYSEAVEPVELALAVSPLTTAFDTETVNGKTSLVLRGIEQGNGGIFDRIVIYAEGGGTYERNIKAQLLANLTWTEAEIEGEVVEGEGEATSGYRYTASLPTSGTYTALRDGLIRSDIEGMTLDGYTLIYDSAEQIVPATAWAGKYVDYQMATPVTGTHTIDPTGKPADDMGTEEVVGGIDPTGTIIISYVRGFKDTTRALMNDFKAASAELDEMKLTKPNYCVGIWIENANTASPADQDNPDALAVIGNMDWALDWRPFLVDMTAVEGETKKHPIMELKKSNWFRDIYGNWAPVVGITTDMYNECMANALYTDNEGQNQYCASGAFDAEAFLALCSITTVDGVKRLTHPTLYKAVTENEETTYVEVTHYLMPWETTETKYSIFVGRKDDVYLIDNVIGASGKEWKGIIAANVNFWDGVNVKACLLPRTGISPSPATAISENGTTKIRSFFYNYPSTLTGVKGRAGYAPNCEMFLGDGHYPTSGFSQITTKTAARANNHTATAPFPVAEGGFHARNTFLTCVETALGTKNLCAASRFGSGITSVDACANESDWLANGGVRIKATGETEWTYKKWSQSGKIFYQKSDQTFATVEMAALLNSYGPHAKTLEAQMAVSFAVEFGIGSDERFMFNGCEWWYQNPTTTGFAPYTLTDGYMNARVYKIVAAQFSAYSDNQGTEDTFTVECCLRTGLMLGCDMSGDIGPYWGGGCEVVGDNTVDPTVQRFGYELKCYIEPDQTKWTNEANTQVNIGVKFGFEDKYELAGTIVTTANGYIRRRLPNTPLPATMGGAFQKGECGYGYMSNYWGTVGKHTRVGVRSGSNAGHTNLSARFLYANASAGSTAAFYCGSAQVLLA